MTEWRVVPERDDYEVSDDGRVRRITTGKNGHGPKELKPHVNFGYRNFHLAKSGKMIQWRAARLVLTVFVGPAPSKEHQAAHNDGNSLNDSLGNLRWATPKENQADRWKHGTRQWGANTPGVKVKLTEAGVSDIRERYAKGEKSTRQLAAIHGVSRAAIARIVLGRSWVDRSPGDSAALDQGAASGR